MSDFKQDADGHLVVENNDVVIVDGADQVRQVLAQRLRTFNGEWFLDRTIGLPYLSDDFMRNKDIAEALMKREILDTPGVLELLEFDYAIDTATRKGSLQFKVRATDGIISLEISQ